MQRYHAASCTSAVNNSAIGGPSARDTSRPDSSSLPSNFALNSRRQLQLAPYKLKCDKEPLNSRLGPPDFHPQTPNCLEETLTKDYVQAGYRETVDGIEEAREISLTQVNSFSKPTILQCKEAIRKRLRAINESRAQKRKAGQAYGIPLSGALLTKAGAFPEQRPCGDDSRRRWIEGLSQRHKRLCSLADHVPHGYRRRALFDVLIRNNVPLLRATWFIKVTYLNQVRRGSASITSGATERTLLSCSEHWTKDLIDYMQTLLDEFFSKNVSHSTARGRDRTQQMSYAGQMQHKSDPTSVSLDGEEPSLHFRWSYLVRIMQWHHAENLIIPSPIIDWVLKQLQEKELLETLPLLLPIIYGVIETFVLSQTYVRTLVGIAVRFIQEPSPGGLDLVDNSRRAYTTSALIEMLRYLILAVPDTFVALDCFPLPTCVTSHMVNDGNILSKVSEDERKLKHAQMEASFVCKAKIPDTHLQSLSFARVVSSIQKRVDNLAKAARPCCSGQSVAKAVKMLDKILVHGDAAEAYKTVFENLGNGAFHEGWIAEVNPCLRSSLKWIGTVSSSFVCSVFFLCEWATCDFRHFRTTQPHDLKFSGRKDFSQVYITIQLLKLKIRDMQSTLKNDSIRGIKKLAKGPVQRNNISSQIIAGNINEVKHNAKIGNGRKMGLCDIFQSPGPLHDIVICWIDQHEALKGEGLKRAQLLIMELTRSGIFYPQAYVRQLIISGIIDRNGAVADLDRRRRHYRILKHMPSIFICDALEEAKIAEVSVLSEAMQVYANERRLVLRGLLCDQQEFLSSTTMAIRQKNHASLGSEDASPSSVDQGQNLQSGSILESGKNVKGNADIEEVKTAIAAILQLPNLPSTSLDVVGDESQGSVKRTIGPIPNKVDLAEVSPGCEECRRVKRQKISEERSSYLPGYSPIPSDDEDTWWVRKGPKSSESLRIDLPVKPIKQPPRGRQKIVRKTQSLAHISANRVDSSQGASTSHVCDSKVSCPHHKSAMEGEAPKLVEGARTTHLGCLISVGKAVKQLRFVDKRAISVWLVTVARQLIEEAEKIFTKVGQYGRPFPPVDDRNLVQWKLGEDELSAILYLLDVTNDLVLASKFLLWLLPKALNSSTSTIHAGRNILMLPRNVENHACDVGEAFVLACLQRHESILIAADLIPEALTASMHRAASTMASNGRISGSMPLIYAGYLLRKYGKVTSVIEWEENVKVTFDKRLISEVESIRAMDSDYLFPLGIPSGVEDLDDYLRQKLSGGRFSRASLSMRDIVHRHVEEAFNYFLSKERKPFVASTLKGAVVEKWDDGYQVAQKIILGLLDCMRQTGGAAQERDPSLVASAVSAIVGNIGPALAKVPELSTTSNHNAGSMNFAQRIIRIHISCLCLLKEALGDRQSRVLEFALATEASNALAAVFAPGKAPRGQFQLSPEAHESNANISNANSNSSAKVVLGKAAKGAAAISALVVGAIIHGVASLERLVTVLRLKEGLDLIQFTRSTRSNSNGNARSAGSSKSDNVIEISVHWFRLLIGNCRTIYDGFIVDLLGEPYIVALSRMQRMLPLNLVLPPAYSMFAFVIWKPFILNANITSREEVHQWYQSLAVAISDAIKHLPFRDVCLRDTDNFYDLVATDPCDAEFAALLELNGSDMLLKSIAFVPLRARLFLNAIIDCKMPPPLYAQGDANRAFGHGELKRQYAENEKKISEKLVHVLDTLQPAKFHWQWVELRLLLNEQMLLEKLESHELPLPEAIRGLSPNPDKTAPSENEKHFIEIILTRLLVRPDAAALYSEVVHLFGRSLEDFMLMQTKWFLIGADVLFGRKPIREKLITFAESKGLSTKPQFSRPWGWCFSASDVGTSKGDRKEAEVSYLEEGEVVDEGTDSKRTGRDGSFSISLQHVTEKALIELVLPCIDQSSNDSRSTFASDLIKQMINIEQHISQISRGINKQAGTASPGIEGPTTKVNHRKNMKAGSPGLSRRTLSIDSAPPPPSPAALRASMSLRLQFLLRLLPVICADGHVLAAVILRLLGSRVVQEEADLSFYPREGSSSKREADVLIDASMASSVHLFGESLFDRLLLVLHALLGSCQPNWLKSRPASKSFNESPKDFSGFDNEAAENLQRELDRMQLPDAVRWRIQAAMPVLLPSVRCFISCQPPSLPTLAFASLQPSPGSNSSFPQRNPVPSRGANRAQGKPMPLPLPQEHDMEVDPWTLLEDGTGSSPSSSNSSVVGGTDHANLKASSLLKGAVRVRRTELTYIGTVDDDMSTRSTYVGPKGIV
ncbi:Mediator complex, subunit Med12 [Dillenia turbinata]|uniref:Mediator complex, subunit Med12 n=1 Tax=Dillenia turbinata TaxID=194707 RepID=A0AAN8Z1S5_9MAGN